MTRRAHREPECQSRGRRKRPAGRRPSVGVDTYRQDALYPRIVRALATILERGKVVAPVDVLVEIGMLSAQDLEDWRRHRVPYLERVVHGNLSRLSRLLRVLAFHAHDLNLVPKAASYARCPRFTKTGEHKLEQVYARHFIWPGKGPFHPPRPKPEPPRSQSNDDEADPPAPGRR